MACGVAPPFSLVSVLLVCIVDLSSTFLAFRASIHEIFFSLPSSSDCFVYIANLLLNCATLFWSVVLNVFQVTETQANYAINEENADTEQPAGYFWNTIFVDFTTPSLFLRYVTRKLYLLACITSLYWAFNNFLRTLGFIFGFRIVVVFFFEILDLRLDFVLRLVAPGRIDWFPRLIVGVKVGASVHCENKTCLNSLNSFTTKTFVTLTVTFNCD